MKIDCKIKRALLLQDISAQMFSKGLLESIVEDCGLEYLLDVEYLDDITPAAEDPRKYISDMKLGEQYSLILIESGSSDTFRYGFDTVVICYESIVQQHKNSLGDIHNVISTNFLSTLLELKSRLIKPDNFDTILIDNVFQLKSIVSELLSQSNGIFFDFETTFTSVWLEESYDICLSFCDLDNFNRVYVIYLNHSDSPFNGILHEVHRIMRPLFDDTNRIVCAHNINFDRAWIEMKWGYTVTARCYDTIAMHHLLDITSKHGLEYLSDSVLGIKDLKGELKEELKRISVLRGVKKLDYDQAPFDILTRYVARDTYAGTLLYQIFMFHLQRTGLIDLFYQYSVPALSKLYELQKYGQNWDYDRSTFLLGVVNKYIEYVDKKVIQLPSLNTYQQLDLYVQKSTDSICSCYTLEKASSGNLMPGEPEDEDQFPGMPETYYKRYSWSKELVKYSRSELYYKVKDKYYSWTKLVGRVGNPGCYHMNSFFYKKSYELTSPKQVGELLFNVFKFPALVKTPKGEPSTDKKAMQALEYALDNGEITDVSEDGKLFAKYLFLSRKFHQTKNTFLISFPENRGSDNFLHSSFLIAGTKTGRLSSNSPNMQQVPSEEKHLRFNAGVKSCIIPRVKGNVFIEVDFSALEYRIVAGLAKDEGMTRAFQEGKIDPDKADIHRHMASVIYGKPYEDVTKDERKDAKTTNFGILYGSSKKTIGEKLNKTPSQVNEIFDALFKSYPNLMKYIENVKEQVEETGKIVNVFGMTYNMIPKRILEEYKKRGRNSDPLTFMRVNDALREAVNYTIQGPGGMLTVMCLTEIDEVLKQKSYRASVDATVHDSILVECPIDRVKEVYEQIIRPVLTKDRSWLNGVPLECDAKVGRTWGCMISYEKFIEDPSIIDKHYDEYTEFHKNFDPSNEYDLEFLIKEVVGK